MPIYEYACGKCGHEFEVEQRITEDPVKTCPACRSRKVKKLISQTSFVLKGGGWYSDLYASPGGKDAKDTKDGKDGKSDSGDGASADTKTTEKPEKKSGGDGKDSRGTGNDKKAKGKKAAA